MTTPTTHPAAPDFVTVVRSMGDATLDAAAKAMETGRDHAAVRMQSPTTPLYGWCPAAQVFALAEPWAVVLIVSPGRVERGGIDLPNAHPITRAANHVNNGLQAVVAVSDLGYSMTHHDIIETITLARSSLVQAAVALERGARDVVNALLVARPSQSEADALRTAVRYLPMSHAKLAAEQALARIVGQPSQGRGQLADVNTNTITGMRG